MLLLLIVPVLVAKACMVVATKIVSLDKWYLWVKTVSRGSSVGVLKLHENTSATLW